MWWAAFLSEDGTNLEGAMKWLRVNELLKNGWFQRDTSRFVGPALPNFESLEASRIYVPIFPGIVGGPGTMVFVPAMSGTPELKGRAGLMNKRKPFPSHYSTTSKKHVEGSKFEIHQGHPAVVPTLTLGRSQISATWCKWCDFTVKTVKTLLDLRFYDFWANTTFNNAGGLKKT